MISQTTGNKLEVQLHNVGEGNATFISSSFPGDRNSPAMLVERYIERYYLGESNVHDSSIGYASQLSTMFTTAPAQELPPHRVACFRTQGTLSPDSKTQLRIHVCYEPKYATANCQANETDIEKIGDIDFLAQAESSTKALYQELIREAISKQSPAVRLETLSSDSARLVIAYRRGSTHSYWSAISDLYHYYGLYCVHKQVEQFANGIQLFNLYLRLLSNSSDSIEEKAKIISEQALSLAYILPRTSFTPLFQSHKLSYQEICYAYVGWKFAFQFLNRYGNEYLNLAQAIGSDPTKQALLDGLKVKLTRDAFTQERILDSMFKNLDLIRKLYADFVECHMPQSVGKDKASSKRQPKSVSTDADADLLTAIKRAGSELDCQVFMTILSFNRHILKTNFYQKGKTALAFRLDPSFLDTTQYANVPFGIFFVVGSEFRAFHVRFREIARGGVRMIKSVNATVYDHNALSLFDENYNLASTQQSKNKDIPEGGSKGTILLGLDHQSKADTAFRKYVDALLDLLLPSATEIVDHYNKEEILFLGPDEGTADYMDWASQYAKERSYPFWKSFTTGKSRSLGGIPHDYYGMTTRSIHQYVIGTLERLALKEEECTKFQTGGPDGDLGSNEIKISKDKTTGIVDGSGVLYDPHGLNRGELERLADKRLMARNFDKSQLSKDGFFVDVDDKDVTLPDGTLVDSGLSFRNGFHLHSLSSATYFVPCGGRPEAVQLTNVDKLFTTGHDNKTVPRYRFIVEGANLFFTQKARLVLEDRGVIIFKDASANKGGVTSSSLEVLAALALSDDEFAQHMSVQQKDGQTTVPQFYENYVKEVQHIIEENARLEFDCIWREYELTKTARSILSDLLSTKINNLNDQIRVSPLWDNEKLREKVLALAIPKTLINLLGLSTVVSRVPDNYLRAIFGAYLASRYVYECGLNSPEFAFFTFIRKHLESF
eukprot:TRINITY_DN147_c0_g1_i1.p1 TRINITY_DN147_c0_g1~~TRINITY_DN147_c0_g1_i1.p1  ORF type:complete len:947 (+),score=276.37 TRINITY_DN147_c0_g1_i1:400-3240(+)